MIIVFDDLDVTSRVAAMALEEIERFLKADGGKLAYPTTVDFVTNKGLEFEAGPSQDGKAIGTSLNKHAMRARLEQHIGSRSRFRHLRSL